jgi:hypothetical protein
VFDTAALLLRLSAYCSHYRQVNVGTKRSQMHLPHLMSSEAGKEVTPFSPGGVGCKAAPFVLR